MSSTRNILASMVPTLIGLVVGIMACALIDRCASPAATEHADTVRVVVADTVRVVQPIPRDSAVVRYVTVRVPTTFTRDTTEFTTAVQENDSVEVVLPITQKVYADSLYRAWVSGYMPSLDSIEVYNKKEYITVTPKHRPWGIGVTAGIGITPRGCQPYIGVGVTYTIKAF